MWVIDFESSGLHRSSYPIEVGITNGEVEYQALIYPMRHWVFWSNESEKVHGISRDFLLERGQNAGDVAIQLNSILRGKIVYCDAIAWDGFWLRVLFSDNGIHQHFELCDVASLLETDTQIEQFLKERAYLASTGLYRQHRALDDARLLSSSLKKAIISA